MSAEIFFLIGFISGGVAMFLFFYLAGFAIEHDRKSQRGMKSKAELVKEEGRKL